jgi:hypothetical protein
MILGIEERFVLILGIVTYLEKLTDNSKVSLKIKI